MFNSVPEILRGIRRSAVHGRDVTSGKKPHVWAFAHVLHAQSIADGRAEQNSARLCGNVGNYQYSEIVQIAFFFQLRILFV